MYSANEFKGGPGLPLFFYIIKTIWVIPVDNLFEESIDELKIPR